MMTNSVHTLSPNTTNTQQIDRAVYNKANIELADSPKKEERKTDMWQINTVKQMYECDMWEIIKKQTY